MHERVWGAPSIGVAETRTLHYPSPPSGMKTEAQRGKVTCPRSPSQEQPRTDIEASWFLKLDTCTFPLPPPRPPRITQLLKELRTSLLLSSLQVFCPPQLSGPPSAWGPGKRLLEPLQGGKQAVSRASTTIFINVYHFAAPPHCLLPAGPSMSSPRLLFCLFLLSEK